MQHDRKGRALPLASAVRPPRTSVHPEKQQVLPVIGPNDLHNQQIDLLRKEADRNSLHAPQWNALRCGLPCQDVTRTAHSRIARALFAQDRARREVAPRVHNVATGQPCPAMTTLT